MSLVILLLSISFLLVSLGLFPLLLLKLLIIGLFALNCVVYFSSMNRYTPWSCYTKTNLISANINDYNLDVVADRRRRS